jgi:steroid delta-isomerase-like uncharacterized protein
MKEEEIRKIYEDYYTAIKAKPFDLDKVVAFFAEDIYYEDLAFAYICRNKAEARAYFDKFWAVWPDNVLEITWFLVSGNKLACEWVWTIPKESLASAAAASAGMSVPKDDLKVNGVSIQELDEKGKIKWGRDYYNLFQITQQFGVPTEVFLERLKL